MTGRDPLVSAPLVPIGPDSGAPLVRRRAAQFVAANAVTEFRRHPSGWVNYRVGRRGRTVQVVLHTHGDAWSGQCPCRSGQRGFLCQHLLAAAHFEAASTGRAIPLPDQPNPEPPASLPPHAMEGFYD